MKNSNTNKSLSKGNKSKVAHIWLATVEGFVFIKKPLPDKPQLSVGDLTISSSDETPVSKLIEDEWNILCDESDLREIYTFEEKSSEYTISHTGYILVFNLSYDELQLLSRNYGSFINYKNIEDFIMQYTKDAECKESFYSLIHYIHGILTQRAVLS